MKKLFAVMTSAVLALSLVGCGPKTSSTGGSSSTESTVSNADKPLVWYNRQPSNSTTGELDKEALNFNKDTYYVGFDANQGAELQGKMVADYIAAHKDIIDRNGDGVIGYVLAIGDVGHNDSIARTRGVRKALGTAVEKDGTIDATPAGTNTDGSANNDGMGMSMFTAWAKEKKVATFGYDANSDAVAAIAEGYGGTISQHADVQAYLTLRVLRNALDGVDIKTGIATADEAGNVLKEGVDYVYNEADRSFYALNLAVTADNYKDFMDATKTFEPVSKEVKSDTKKVWLNIYNASDNFLSSTYQPLLEKYDDLLHLDVEYIGGDGQTESNITNRLGNPSQYDAYAINMVKTDNATSYTSLLK